MGDVKYRFFFFFFSCNWGSVVGLMVGRYVCVCVCLFVCLWGLTGAGRLRWNWWIRLAELSDRNITIKPSAQCLPLPPLFLSLINTGIGLQFGQVLGQQGRLPNLSAHTEHASHSKTAQSNTFSNSYTQQAQCVCGSGFASFVGIVDLKTVITYWEDHWMLTLRNAAYCNKCVKCTSHSNKGKLCIITFN